MTTHALSLAVALLGQQTTTPVLIPVPPTPFAPVVQNQVSWADVMSGKAMPLTVKLDDIGEAYQAVELTIAGATSDAGAGIMGAMMGMMMGATNPYADLMSKHWTTGETINIGGHAYLVTYKAKVNPDAQSMTEDMPKFNTSDELRLTLVLSSSIASFSPTGIGKAKAIELRNQPPDLGGLMGGLGGLTQPDDEPESELPPKAESYKRAVALGKAIRSYADIMEKYPEPEDAEDLVYVVDMDGTVGQTVNPNGGAFVMNPKLRGLAPVEGKRPLFYETEAWPDGSRLVGYTDGTVEEVEAKAWSVLARSMGVGR